MSAPAIELKGSLFTLLVLRLLRPDLEATAAELREKVEQAPGFFADAPVVVDLKSLEGLANAVDFDDLRRIVRDAGLVPVGVRNGTPKQQQAALAAGFGVIPEGRMAPEREERPQCAGKVVSQQVRSGQQLFSPRGELVVVGAVSNGAEVLAEGSIHIYGPLRGRALAGVRGNEEARIFCRALEAELVSIAGTYLLAEDIADEFRGRPAQIFLRDERLIIEGL